MKGLIALHSGLLICAFLVMLNSYLRGRLKGLIDAALSITLIGLLVLSWILFSWKVLLISIGLCFVYAILTRPIARFVAQKLIKPPFKVACVVCHHMMDALPEGRICPKCGLPQVYTAEELAQDIEPRIRSVDDLFKEE